MYRTAHAYDADPSEQLCDALQTMWELGDSWNRDIVEEWRLLKEPILIQMKELLDFLLTECQGSNQAMTIARLNEDMAMNAYPHQMIALLKAADELLKQAMADL